MIEEFASIAACDVSSAMDSVQHDSVKIPAMSRLAVNQLTTVRWSFLEDLHAFRAHGFKAAGLWRPKVVRFGEARAVELVRDLELAVSSLSWAGGFTGANGESFYDAVDDARQAVHLAGALNAECLVLVSGPQCGHIGSHARRLVVDAIKALAEDAAEQGVPLALQPMSRGAARNWSFLRSLDETLDVIERSGRGARIAFDVFHLWDAPRLLDRIPELASRVAVVQLCDGGGAARSSDQERRAFGGGEIPLSAIVAAFDEAGFSGYYELAVWSEELWQSDYSRLLRECRTHFDLNCRRYVPRVDLDRGACRSAG